MTSFLLFLCSVATLATFLELFPFFITCGFLVDSLAFTMHAYFDLRVAGLPQVSLHWLLLTLQGTAGSIGAFNFPLVLTVSLNSASPRSVE